MNLPALHGNWIDLLIVLLVIFYLWGGWKRGLLLGILDLSGFFLSFFAALRSYSFFGQLLITNFSLPRGIANAAGFLIGGILSEIILSSVIRFMVRRIYPLFSVKKKQSKTLLWLSRFDKILGFVPAIGEAIVFAAFTLTLLVVLPIQGVFKSDILSSKLGGPLVVKTQGLESELNNIFGEAVNETLTFLTINPNLVFNERVELQFKQTDIKIDERAEQVMLGLINQERVKAGLRHLSLSWELRDLARDYAKELFAKGYFSHYDKEGLSPFDRMEKKGINYTVGGENLALAPNASLAHQGLMSSSGHRANILSPQFGRVGIGVIDGGIYGKMFVQEFTD